MPRRARHEQSLTERDLDPSLPCDDSIAIGEPKPNGRFSHPDSPSSLALAFAAPHRADSARRDPGRTPPPAQHWRGVHDVDEVKCATFLRELSTLAPLSMRDLHLVYMSARRRTLARGTLQAGRVLFSHVCPVK